MMILVIFEKGHFLLSLTARPFFLLMINWDGVAASFNKDTLGHTCICEAKANRQEETCIMIPLPKGKTLEKRAYRRLGD
jgi:hypothetical protein